MNQPPGKPDRLKVLVTAGAAGIGRAIAELFLNTGALVHVCDIDARALAAFLQSNPSARGSHTDVADANAVADMFKEVRAGMGSLDVLVSNAGISGPVAPVESVEPEEWSRTLEVNLSGAFHCARHAVPLLREGGGGLVVFIGSTAGLHGCPLRAPYVASKWGLLGLMRTMAMELGPEGIRVNTICPGSVAGPRIERVIAEDAKASGESVEAVRARYQRQNSLRVFIEPEDVANMVGYLASPEGARISGQALGLDGHTESFASS